MPSLRTLLVVITLLLCLPTPVLATGGELANEQELVALINAERARNGLRQLAVLNTLNEVARWRSEDMLTRDYFSHTILGTEQQVWPYLTAQGLRYTAAGENLAWNSGYADSAAATFEGWMNSPGHRANILNPDWTHIGLGFDGADSLSFDGRQLAPQMYTALFATTAYAAPLDAATGFDDTLGSVFGADIAWLVGQGAAPGCAPQRYCTGSRLTRGDLARMLDWALDLPIARDDRFSDDNGSLYEGAAERLAAAGLTYGCGAGNYCGTSSLPRAQMASFLVRAFGLPPATHDYFSDDTGSVHEADINALAAAGITHGCATGRFCPSQAVTRGEMAAFLHHALTR